VTLIDSIQKKFHTHLLTQIASSELIILIFGCLCGLVAHCSFLSDSFLQFFFLSLQVFFNFLESFQRSFFALGDDLLYGSFGVVLCVFEFLLSVFLSHDDFSRSAF